MTKAEDRLCYAAERYCHWGRMASTYLSRTKFDHWKRRMRSAAHDLYRERTPRKPASGKGKRA